MKNITFAEAAEILMDCAAVILEGVVTYPYFSDDDEEDSIAFHWEDEGYDREARFPASRNQTASVAGSSLFLVDEDGDDVQLTILCEKKLD